MTAATTMPDDEFFDSDFVPVSVAEERPVIKLTTELHESITSAIAALSADPNIYQREGIVVDVVRSPGGTADRLSTAGAPKIRILSSATLMERLTRVAKFLKFDARKGKWVPSLPSTHVVGGTLARGEYSELRPIVGMLEAPSMRSDGTIIQTRGYDPRTAYLYEPSAEFPAVPDRPSQADATKALADIEEIFADFPFGVPAHRSAAVAALLTIIARPAIEGAVPAFLADASTRGTGKTSLPPHPPRPSATTTSHPAAFLRRVQSRRPSGRRVDLWPPPERHAMAWVALDAPLPPHPRGFTP